MRAWVLALALANLAFFVWTQGWISPWLPAPWQGQREPQRVLEQIRPERVAVRRPPPAASAPQTGASGALAGGASISANPARPASSAP